MKLLVNPYSNPSARLLRDKLQYYTNRKIWVTSNPNRINGDFIRYGNREPVRIEDTEYNSSEFIGLSANKLAFSVLMKENNIHSPKYSRDINSLVFPLIIRETLNGCGGEGIRVCRNEEEFNRNWSNCFYWTSFVHTQFELRAHILGGEIKRIFRKEFEGDTEEDFPIRNMHRGYHFSLRDVDRYVKVFELVERLNSIINGKFFSLDLGWDREKGEYFVFEVNSASGLNENTAEVYANYLSKEFEL